MLYTSLLYNATPIHCTPLPLHPPAQIRRWWCLAWANKKLVPDGQHTHMLQQLDKTSLSLSISLSLSLYIYIYIYSYVYYLFVYFWSGTLVYDVLRHPLLRRPLGQHLRPIFVLRIFKFGVWVKQILKRRRWTFLVHRLIPWRGDFGILTQRFLVWKLLV